MDMTEQLKLMRAHDAFNADLDRQDAEYANTPIDARSQLPETEWIEGYYDISAALKAALKAIS